MPTYEFRCPIGHDFERFYKTMSSAPSEVACPECGALASRQLSAGGGLVFKGSGFYLTDYGKNAHRGSAPDKKGDGASEGGKSESGKGDSGRVEGGKAEGGKAEGGKAEGGRAEGGRSEGGTSDSRKGGGEKSAAKPEPKSERAPKASPEPKPKQKPKSE